MVKKNTKSSLPYKTTAKKSDLNKESTVIESNYYNGESSDSYEYTPNLWKKSFENFYGELLNGFSKFIPKEWNYLNLEVISKTFAETHTTALDYFVNQPSHWDNIQQNYLKDLEKLHQMMLERFNGLKPKPIIEPEKSDKRFKAEYWNDLPVFDYIKQTYLLQSNYIIKTLDAIDRLPENTKNKIKFYVKQILDAVSPTNFPFTNPEVWHEILRTNGHNLIDGYKRLLEDQNQPDFLSPFNFTDMKHFVLGENLATTAGKVIFENYLIQLIYYEPTTVNVYEEPLLIIPPWINKYYIFDLQSHNSFIAWALSKGIQVFVVSWVNPDHTYADVGLQEYILDGVLAATKQIQKLLKTPVHILGYCAGGVATVVLTAYLNAIKDPVIKSLTMLAVPIDFNKMGDLKVFICEEQLNFLEKNINEHGIFHGDIMVRIFSLLRTNDMIWSNFVNTYFLNKGPAIMDFLYWNCDTTHMPAKMHIEYLRKFFLENLLIKEDGYILNHIPINLKNITVPTFLFATKNDHIVNWQSSFAFKEICPKNTTFVLGASGHVAGIINPESKQKYSHWIDVDNQCIIAEKWTENATEVSGSWWSTWLKWITPQLGTKTNKNCWSSIHKIEDAPGRYAKTTIQRQSQNYS